MAKIDQSLIGGWERIVVADLEGVRPHHPPPPPPAIKYHMKIK